MLFGVRLEIFSRLSLKFQFLADILTTGYANDVVAEEAGRCKNQLVYGFLRLIATLGKGQMAVPRRHTRSSVPHSSRSTMRFSSLSPNMTYRLVVQIFVRLDPVQQVGYSHLSNNDSFPKLF